LSLKLAHFSANWPSGAYALSRFLCAYLGKAPPIESWDVAGWKKLWVEFDAWWVKQVKNVAASGMVVERAQQDQHLSRGPALRKARDMRLYLRKLHFEAQRAYRDVYRYITENIAYAAEIGIWIRDWQRRFKQAYGEGIKPEDQLLITAIVAAKLFDAHSDQLSIHVLRDVQQGERAIRKRPDHDFPASQGDIHHDDPKNASHYTLQTVPHRGEDGIQFWRDAHPAESSVEIYRSLGQQAQQQIDEQMTRYARELGDVDADLLTFLMARYSEHARDETDTVKVALDELMAFSYARQQGGTGGKSFRVRDEDILRRRIENLQRLDLTLRGVVQGQQYIAQGRLFVIWNKFGRGTLDLDGVLRRWDGIEYSFGRVWSRRIFQLGGSQMMRLQMQVLRYDPRKERFAKRLGKYLGPFWRMNVRHERFVYARSVRETIVDGLTEDLERFQTRRHVAEFESALDRLASDGVIQRWRYGDNAPRISDHDGRLPHGWVNEWLQRSIWVEIPEALRQHYAKETSSLLSRDLNALTGAEIGAWRAKHDMGLRDLASALEVDPGNLSKIERGERKLTLRVAEKFLQHQRTYRLPAHMRQP